MYRTYELDKFEPAADHNPDLCPFCGGADGMVTDQSFEGPVFFADCCCTECGARWVLHFGFEGFTPIKPPDAD